MGKIEQMRAFVTVVDKGHFFAAAEELGISDAAISKMVKSLEEGLGVQLLERTTRKVHLTEIGRSYYEQCLKVFEEIEISDRLVESLTSEPSGRLVVASGRHFGEKYLIPNLSEWVVSCPKVELSVLLMERIPDFEAEGVDVLVGMSISAAQDAIQRKIATTRYVLCASPKYLEQAGTPKKPEELISHQYITHYMRQLADVITFRRGKEVKVKPILYLNDVRAMHECALAGLGIIKVHHYVVEESLKKGELVEILSQENEGDFPIYLAYRNLRFVPNKIRCFVDFVLRQVKNLREAP